MADTFSNMPKSKQSMKEPLAESDTSKVAPKVAMMELVSFRLHSVANLLSRGAAMRYKREFGVTLWEWRTIALVGAQAGLSLNELAKIAGLDKSQVSRVVTGLTDRGLMLRRADDNDARGIRLSLTREGERLYEGLISAASERNELVLATLGKDDRLALQRALGKLEVLAREIIREEKNLTGDT
jgi:DNA-binding MarR family transcriptional regulator